MTDQIDTSIRFVSGVSTAIGMSFVLTACGGADDPVQRLQNEMPKEELDFLRVKNRVMVAKTVGLLRTPTAEELFVWAQRTYPLMFIGSPTTQIAEGGLLYRAYANNTFLGVRGTDVLVLGPVSQGQLLRVGSLADFPDAATGAAPVSDLAATRFLLQAQFSASAAEIAAVRNQGFSGWLDQQLKLPNSQSGWDWMVSKGYSAIDIHEYFFANGTCKYMIWHQLLQSPDAVRRRWAWALSGIFVVSWRGIRDVMNWDSFGMAEYWDVLCRKGFGTYRELLEELTLNPAMGAFLGTRGNRREDVAEGRMPDENYAREVMQLFSIGLNELNMDGSLKLGADGKAIETYSAEDVTNLARVFTGYDHNNAVGWFNSPKPPNPRVANLESARGRMVFEPRDHSALQKRFLGVSIAANTPGPESLRIALDTLANHPTTAPFLARQFIQRMVTSDPSPNYVQRVAQVFNNNGSGVRGDLKAVLRAVLLDDEARNVSNLASNTFGKLREPVLRIAQWGRTFKARSLRGTWKMRLGEWDPKDAIAQEPLDPPSVFGYFRPGYIPPGTAMAALRATAPEFQLVNESTVSSWTNLLIGFLYQGVWVNAPEVPFQPNGPSPTDGPDIVPDYQIEKSMVADSQALVDHLNLMLCAGQLSASTVQLIVGALRADRIRADSPDDFKQIHVSRALLFVMSSAEYLVQR